MSQRENDLATIAAVPCSELPDGPARATLVALVEQGMHIYCFCSYAAEPDESPWRIWLEPLLQLHGYPRIHLDEWVTNWATYYRLFTKSAE